MSDHCFLNLSINKIVHCFLNLPVQFYPFSYQLELITLNFSLQSPRSAVLDEIEAANCKLMDTIVRNRTLTLIEREDDTRSYDNFLVYFSHNVMPT
jgi:hypothetical protein